MAAPTAPGPHRYPHWGGYEDQSGSGLGLFITRSIAREHKGTAVVVDRPDGGTILQIRVPLGGET